LLALWAYPRCIVPLSYRLHKELADKHNGTDRWGYRALHCGQIEVTGTPHSQNASKPDQKAKSVSLQKRSAKAIDMLRKAKVPEDLDWINPEGITAYESMGDPTTTAQVHPYQFTTSMAKLAEEKGVKIVYGMATQIKQESGTVTGLTYKSKDNDRTEELKASTIILTAGPWTRRIWPSAPIEALRAHSVVIKPSRPVSAYALFTAIDLPKGSSGKRRETVTPEIYARPDSTIYACGEGDTLVPLPDTTKDVQVDERRCEEIVSQVGAVSEELRDGVVEVRQACYLPNVSGKGGGPLIGETGVKGLLMGAGHTCWGIQNAPATGKVLSEMVWDGRAKSAEIGNLDPRKFL
jgi:glycine/D-amino acid oxidase-like deaminating enzyme